MPLHASALALLGLLVASTHAARWVQTSSSSYSQHQRDLIAAESIRAFDLNCSDAGLPPPLRFEKFASEWTDVLLRYRSTTQQVSGVVHEKDAMSTLLAQAMHVYDKASIPLDFLRAVLAPIAANKDWTWVHPDAHTGYITRQIRDAAGVNIDGFSDQSQYLKWMTMSPGSPTNEQLQNYDVLVLVQPCADADKCWEPLRVFQTSPRAKAFVYIGEPRGHCCGNVEFWNHLCKHWKIRSFQPVPRGLPASYEHVMLFTPRGSKSSCTVDGATGQCVSDDNGVRWQDAMAASRATQFSQFLAYCDDVN